MAPMENLKGPEAPREIDRESVIQVAAVQMEPLIAQKAHNIEKTLAAISRAARQGAQLIVLPELCNTGFAFHSREEALSVSEPIPEGESCAAWIRIAREKQVFLVAGLIEREGHRLYNAAVLIGPEGYIGKYRKCHRWDIGKLFFEPGDLGLPVFDLPFGRVGLMICYDGWFPEVGRILALQGADILCDPTNWVVVPEVQTPEHPAALQVHAALAICNGVFVVCADRVGVERGCTYLGHSCILDPAGRFLAGPGSYREEEILMAEVNVVRARYRQWTPLNHIHTDRRTDLYDLLVGYRPPEAAQGSARHPASLG